MTSPGPGLHVEVVAPVPPGDVAAVAEVLAAAEAADGYPSISEQASLDSEPEPPAEEPSAAVPAQGRPDAGSPACSLLAWSADGAGAGARRLVGYGTLERPHGRWVLELAVHPAHRDRAGTAEGAIVDAAQGHVAGAGGGALSVWVRSGADEGASWLTDRGFTPGRQLLQLRAPLPIATDRRPQDRVIDVRPFHPGRDEHPWLEVNRRAFDGHPEQSSWTLADLERRERAPWFDPRGFLIHEIDRRIAGFCWTKVHRSPLVGEIYVIGVDPDFQGRGLGRALTVAGLEHLATRGVPEAMLYVEATNVAALALYRSLGFAEHHRETVYASDTGA